MFHEKIEKQLGICNIEGTLLNLSLACQEIKNLDEVVARILN